MANTMDEHMREIDLTDTDNKSSSDIDMEFNLTDPLGNVERILSRVVNIGQDQIMHEPTCPICCSSLREESEDLWLKNGQDWKPIAKKFKDHSMVEVSRDIINHHMLRHTDKGTKELQKKEYIGRLNRLSGQNIGSIDGIKLCMTIVLERLTGINSIASDNETSDSEIEKIKTSETIKLIKELSSLCRQHDSILAEMNKNNDLISIPKSDFIRVFNNAIIEAQKSANQGACDIIKSMMADLAKIGQT